MFYESYCRFSVGYNLFGNNCQITIYNNNNNNLLSYKKKWSCGTLMLALNGDDEFLQFLINKTRKEVEKCDGRKRPASGIACVINREIRPGRHSFNTEYPVFVSRCPTSPARKSLPSILQPKVNCFLWTPRDVDRQIACDCKFTTLFLYFLPLSSAVQLFSLSHQQCQTALAVCFMATIKASSVPSAFPVRYPWRWLSPSMYL